MIDKCATQRGLNERKSPTNRRGVAHPTIQLLYQFVRKIVHIRHPMMKVKLDKCPK
jgi:hypothetical protein